MTPGERYRQALEREGFEMDPAQQQAVDLAHRLYQALFASPGSSRRPRWHRSSGRWPPVKGLYLCGAVGRGKTYVMDLLYDCCPFEHKRRVHFHRFMQQVHHELKTLRELADPLDVVSARLAAEARLLCLDEPHVGDVTDAMLLAGLLRSLFNRGVTLVATSNEPPDRLYWNGLQRNRFVPAIELIERHTEVFELVGGVDHRLRTLERAEIYHTPLDREAERCLGRCFERLARGGGAPAFPVQVNGRAIPTVRHGAGVVWFEFEEICGGPRRPWDYLEIALCYHSVLNSGTSHAWATRITTKRGA